MSDFNKSMIIQYAFIAIAYILLAATNAFVGIKQIESIDFWVLAILYYTIRNEARIEALTGGEGREMTCTKEAKDFDCESPCCKRNDEIVRDLMSEYKAESEKKDAEIEWLKAALSSVSGRQGLYRLRGIGYDKWVDDVVNKALAGGEES